MNFETLVRRSQFLGSISLIKQFTLLNVLTFHTCISPRPERPIHYLAQGSALGSHGWVRIDCHFIGENGIFCTIGFIIVGLDNKNMRIIGNAFPFIYLCDRMILPTKLILC